LQNKLFDNFDICKDICNFALLKFKRMLVIPVKEGEQIDRALKRLKRKFLQTGTLKKIREKKQYIKPTERHRVKMQKASYSNALLREME
tara:strand:+ start:2353 stop:2619 length:267 start_codon:yes stop_codon:yes gene_type:complete